MRTIYRPYGVFGMKIERYFIPAQRAPKVLLADYLFDIGHNVLGGAGHDKENQDKVKRECMDPNNAFRKTPSLGELGCVAAPRETYYGYCRLKVYAYRRASIFTLMIANIINTKERKCIKIATSPLRM